MSGPTTSVGLSALVPPPPPSRPPPHPTPTTTYPAGFHIGALTASVGGLGVVLGLATQQLLANLAAAVSLVGHGGGLCVQNCPMGQAWAAQRQRG